MTPTRTPEDAAALADLDRRIGDTYDAIDAARERDPAEVDRLTVTLRALQHEEAGLEERRFLSGLRESLGHGEELLARARAMLRENGQPVPGEDG